MLISNGREILYCWSWVYIRRLAFQKNKLIIFVLTLKFINNNNRDEEKDNPYQKKLLLLTNYGNKCSQCHLGSLCTEKYKVEYILVLSTSSMNSSRQKSVQPLRVLNYSQGFNKQQISISNTMSQQTMFSQKQTTNINMIIVFRTLEKGSQFFKILQKLIPNKLSTSDTFLSFIYHCLFCKFKINFLLQKFSIYQITKNCNYYYQNKKLNALIVFQINLATDNIQRLNLGSDQFNSQGSLNNTMDSKRRMSMDSIGESNSFQQQYSQVKDQGQLQFFIGLEQREQIVQKQKLLSFDLVILASDSKFRDEILIIKEKPSAMFRQQQIYSQIQQYYYFKNHLQSIKNIISQDNINYSAIANELSINSDRLYENILKCFEISRINIKCFAKVEFPNISESSVIISVDQNHFPFEKEKMTKISKTKINVIDKGDDYVDIDLKPRIQHQPQSVRQITLTCELSRQLLKNVVQKSIEADQVINKDSLAQQLNDDYTAQLKHIIRQQHFDQPQSRRQLNRKTSIAATTKRRFSKLKDTVAQKIMPKIFKNSRGTLHNIQEDFNDIEEASLHNDEQEIN